MAVGELAAALSIAASVVGITASLLAIRAHLRRK